MNISTLSAIIPVRCKNVIIISALFGFQTFTEFNVQDYALSNPIAVFFSSNFKAI